MLLLEYTHSFDDTTRNGAWQVLSRIFTVSGNTRVLLLCDTYTQLTFAGFIQHGASGCVPSSCETSLLAKAVHTVHEGETWFDRTDLLQALRTEMHRDHVLHAGRPGDADRTRAGDPGVDHHIYVKLARSGRYKAFLSNTATAPPPPSAIRKVAAAGQPSC